LSNSQNLELNSFAAAVVVMAIVAVVVVFVGCGERMLPAQGGVMGVACVTSLASMPPYTFTRAYPLLSC